MKNTKIKSAVIVIAQIICLLVIFILSISGFDSPPSEKDQLLIKITIGMGILLPFVFLKTNRSNITFSHFLSTIGIIYVIGYFISILL